MGTLPTVAIVGRPNVGKSALFNRLAQRRIAIVHDQPGVTRDRLVAECNAGLRSFAIVDTGGIGGGTDSRFEEQVRAEAELAMDMADVIVFVTDAQAGVTPADQMLAQVLRKTRKPIIVAVNKIDHERHASQESEFSMLGFGDLLPISAAHGRGIPELLERVEQELPPAPEPAEIDGDGRRIAKPLRLAIVGRPNVGKSSLINAILQDERTIVSEVAGTTRDAVDIPYERDGKPFLLIDTAGIRPRSKHNTSVEVFSVMRAEKSIERADVCALVIDAVDGVTAQDKKIAGLIQENEKPCIVVVNKLDLVRPPTRVRDFLEGVLGQIRTNLYFLSYAPIDILSAQTRENLGRLFGSVEKIESHSGRTIGTGQLNRLLQNALEQHPPPLKGQRRLKIFYATQLSPRAGVAVPAPNFLLFVNQVDLLADDYRRYLEGRIRDHAGYYGLPVLFRLRPRREA
ncbi:MAG: ribosome biogenesis GTPase Der [Verrucomicrobia bacterium]|nr:ribosome biogenesis GTPase Der [Verrucomicrobiota bacterium]